MSIFIPMKGGDRMEIGRRLGTLLLSTIAEVKRFPDIAMSFKGDLFLKHKRSVIDATSLMGIFSLDLSEPIGLYAIADDDEINRLIAQISKEGYNFEVTI